MDIKTTCLGVLMLGAASGYEIRKSFEEGPFSHFAEGGFGSIYPALTKMTQEGLVTCTAHQQEKRPAKKVYQITDAGWTHLETAMRDKIPGEDKIKSDLLFMLFFADWQSPERIARVIDARIAFYQQKLDEMADCGTQFDTISGRSLVLGYGIAVFQASLDYLVANREAFIEVAGQAQPPLLHAAE
ncbi:MAG: PadR family transcriptional regulator [Alphaproteobacteria bacterium]|nr:PadR family transcriptional regulator [Alphaproteobacteria bacterium]